MFSTRSVLELLRRANPGRAVTEDLLRSAVRRDRFAPPPRLSGRFIWSLADIRRLAEALGLTGPNVSGEPTDADR